MMVALSFTTGDAAAMIFVATFSPQCEAIIKEAGKVKKYLRTYFMHMPNRT
jgi:hypothetical protein